MYAPCYHSRAEQAGSRSSDASRSVYDRVIILQNAIILRYNYQPT